MTTYSILKKFIPRSVRSFFRDRDAIYQNLQTAYQELQNSHQQTQVAYQELQNSHQQTQVAYQELQNSHQQTQVAYQELQDLYAILGSSHRKLLGSDISTIKVITDKPVAYDSPDHLEPWGTKQDNSINLKFNAKLAKWISLENLSLLDLGCSGGGAVKSILDFGCLAVGIEGSDYSKLRGRAEWSTIPNNLFTSDVTEPFQVINDATGSNLQFTVITAWEFIEHIRTDKLPNVFQNVSKHLAKNGVFIMSVSPNEDVINGVRLHQTVENKEWWLEECQRNRFVHHEQIVDYFGEDWVRSEPNAHGSFHLILTRVGEQIPYIKRLLSVS